MPEYFVSFYVVAVVCYLLLLLLLLLFFLTLVGWKDGGLKDSSTNITCGNRSIKSFTFNEKNNLFISIVPYF